MNIKGLIILIIVIVAGIVAYQQLTVPPDPQKVRAEAQQTSRGVVDYLLNAMMLDRDTDAAAVCAPNTRGQMSSALKFLRQREEELGSQCDSYNFFGMGTPDAYKAILSSNSAGVLLQMTVIAEKKDGTYHVTQISVD